MLIKHSRTGWIKLFIDKALLSVNFLNTYTLEDKSTTININVEKDYMIQLMRKRWGAWIVARGQSVVKTR